MRVTHLSLTNYRNYGRLELDLPLGPTLLHGGNAQGKTNLLESIFYLATARSPHADQDQQLINWDALDPEEPIVVAKITAQIETTGGMKQVEIRLIKEQQRGQSSMRRQALVDRRKVRLMDLLGNVRVVLFLPEDVQIVGGPPSQRRRYMDITLCQVDRHYCRTLSTYNKVLEQRNALLRRIAEDGNGRDVLPVYSEKLVHLGSQIFAQRAAFIAALAGSAQDIHYDKLTDRRETLKLHYLPRLTAADTNRGDQAAVEEAISIGELLVQEAAEEAIAERFEQLLIEVQAQEIASGSTRIGPHRDDWRFWVNGRSLADYGSRGQQRTALLALKLAEIEWMSAQSGETPILLLDEVVAELDEHRRALLLETIQGVSQALVTATDPKMFTKSFLDQATSMLVVKGQVVKNGELVGS